MPENNADVGIYLLVGIMVVVFFPLLMFGLVSFIHEFSRELKYLNCEINRTEGEERRYYIRQRRRLWLSLFLFVKY